MLDVIRRGQRWVTALFVVGVGGVFIFFIGLGGPLRGRSGDAVIVAGTQRIGLGEFERTREQYTEQYRQALGEQFDARALSDTLDAATGQVLLQRAILALEAERLGLTVAKQEVEREILSNAIFRDASGGFDKQAFDGWVAYQFGSERLFREQQRRASLASKLMRVIRSQARVSPGEAREAVERRLEKVRIAFVALDTTPPADEFERDEAAIAAFLATREAEARALYETRADRYQVPEQARARHVLLRVPDDASEEEVAAVERRAQEVLERLRAGEAFAAVAEEVSEDPGSRANGGDLGYFRRGQMVPAFEEAAFSLEPGTLSEPVRTPYGFHIIRVEDRKPAEHHTFEEVREELAFELLRREAGRREVQASAEALAEAVRAGSSLEDAARGANLTLERTGLLTRRPDGFVPGLGAAQELMAVAFTLEPGQSSDRIFEVGDKLALLQVLEREAPSPEEVEVQVAAERQRLESQKLNLLTETWIDQRREQLAEQGQLAINLDALGRR